MTGCSSCITGSTFCRYRSAIAERPDDVPELVRFYAETFPNQENLPYRPFSVAAQNRLRNHSWPGNIRELRNLVQRLLVLGGESEVSVAEVEEALQQNPSEPESSKPGGTSPFFDLPLREAREQFEREYLVYKLKEAGAAWVNWPNPWAWNARTCTENSGRWV